ncbi:type II toxin-antitoxin system RelE/ParE family toxin [archaeon]|nr:type II toxin-antitoxin system RelE/ParE family toxin [archaeon]
MYNLEIRENVDRIFKKLIKKDKISFAYLSKKIEEIKENPYHFKPLKKPLQNFWRVYIGSYVLIYSIDEKRKTVILEKYKHHKEVYKI